MKDNLQLRKYLLRSFLVTLVFIGLAQILVGGIITALINPMIESTLSLDHVLSSSDIRTTYIMIFEIILTFVIQRGILALPLSTGIMVNSVLEKLFEKTMVDEVANLAAQIHGADVGRFIGLSLLFLLLTIVIWLLPYIIGGIFFAKIVTRKVNELEWKRKEKEREEERQRNLMLSDMAHDIKTPITTIMGFSRALADGEVPEESREQYLNAICAKSQQINDLVTLLFEYVKLDSSGYTLHKVSTDICELTRKCISRVYADFEEKHMELSIGIPEEELRLDVDPTQMERAVANILSNTIRHNPEGTPVEIRVETDGGKHVWIRISDRGVAIDRQVASHLFEPFVQGDASRSSGSGSGLGLSITKKIVEMHGGRVILYQYRNPEKYGKVKMFEIRL